MDFGILLLLRACYMTRKKNCPGSQSLISCLIFFMVGKNSAELAALNESLQDLLDGIQVITQDIEIVLSIEITFLTFVKILKHINSGFLLKFIMCSVLEVGTHICIFIDT